MTVPWAAIHARAANSISRAVGNRTMSVTIIKTVKWASILFLVIAAAFLSIRIYDSQRGPPLSPWHTYVPQELSAAEIDATDWDGYLAREQKIFEDVRTAVTQRLDPDERLPLNRYFTGSPIYPGRFAQDFNRSYILQPDGPPVGAVVLLH